MMIVWYDLAANSEIRHALPRFQFVLKIKTPKGTGQNNYTRTGPTFGVGGGVLKDTTYLQTLPTTFYWLLNVS